MKKSLPLLNGLRPCTSEAAIEKAEKEGLIRVKAIHPVTKAEVPVWIANFILMDYGTGAIFDIAPQAISGIWILPANMACLSCPLWMARARKL